MINRYFLSIKDFIFKKPFILEIAVGLISAMFLLIATWKYGLAYSNDSVNYMRIAESIWEGKGFFFSNGAPYVRYAPLYPMILSLSHLIGLDSIRYAMILNIIIYGLLIAVVLHWYRSLGNSRFTLIIGTIMILGSRPIFIMSSKMWTELLFIFLSLIFIISISKYLANQDNNRRFFSVAIVSVMFACLIRYVGITLILTGCLLIFMKSNSWKRKIWHSFIFGFLTSIPTAFFVIRNYWITSTFVGDRYPSNKSLVFILSNVSSAITNLFVPAIVPRIYLIIGFFPLIISIGLVLIWILKKSNDKPYVYWCSMSAFSFSVIYTLYIIFSAKMVGFNSLLTRFLSIIYIPIIMILLVFITLFFKKEKIKENRNFFKVKNSKLFKKIISAFFTITSLLMFLSVLYYSYYIYENSPGGLGSPEIRDSDLTRYVLEDRPEGKLYSNIPNAFYGTDLNRNVHYYPRKTFEASDVSPDDLAHFNRTLELRGSVVIIWFDIEHDYLYEIDELKNMYDFQIIKSFNDGVVYRFYLKE